jgi:hypothetical protein
VATKPVTAEACERSQQYHSIFPPKESTQTRDPFLISTQCKALTQLCFLIFTVLHVPHIHYSSSVDILWGNTYRSKLSSDLPILRPDRPPAHNDRFCNNPAPLVRTGGRPPRPAPCPGYWKNLQWEFHSRRSPIYVEKHL